MADIITSSAPGVVPVTPRLVLGWQTAREARTVVHDLLYSAVPVVTQRPLAPRKGRLTYFFETAAEAQACYNMHLAAAVFTLNVAISDTTDTLRYVVADGDLAFILDQQTARATTVEVPYREVPLA